MVLLTGAGPFDLPLLTLKPARRPQDWSRQVEAAAKARGWRAESQWYRVVDRKPNAPAAPRPRRPAAIEYRYNPTPYGGAEVRHSVKELEGLL
jgi:hypothetical protein